MSKRCASTASGGGVSKKARSPVLSSSTVPMTGAPKVYERTGTGRGNTDSTVAGRKSAML